MQRIADPSVSRREIVAGFCATLVLAACSSGAAPEEEAMDQASPMNAQSGQALATGDMDRWTRMVGSEFTTTGVRLKVAGVQALPSSGARPPDVTREAAFLVVFENLNGGGLPGDLIYRMATSSKQILDVFLANAVTAQFPNRMHAVFN